MTHETLDALDLLDCAWRVNQDNLESFEQRLFRLREIIAALRQGRGSAGEALDQAEALGFIAPLIPEVS